jgi:small-conductance mechanosensitive channel
MHSGVSGGRWRSGGARASKLAFDEEEIEIPFPQQTAWHKPAELTQR